MQKLFFCWILESLLIKIYLIHQRKGEIGGFHFPWKEQGRELEFTSSGSVKFVCLLVCLFVFVFNLAHDHLPILFVFLFVLSVLWNSSKHKLAPTLCESTVQCNGICPFIQISVWTVVTTKRDDKKDGGRKVNKSE